MSADLDAWHAQGHTYRHRGQAVFFRNGGAGEALLLIHGFPTASWDWHKIWPALAQRYRCIAPDMLGFGFSDKPRDYDYRVLDQADLHEGLLEKLGVERCHILAHDYGDTVAQELLARDGERLAHGVSPRVASVCLLNGGLFPESHRPRRIQKLLLGRFGGLLSRCMTRRAFARNLRAVFATSTPPTEAEMDSFWELARRDGGTRIYHRLIRYMEDRRRYRERWVGALQDSSAPLRLINGTADPISGGHMVARYRELIPDADVVELNCGHYPQIEAADAVLDGYLAFRLNLEKPKGG